MASTTTSAVSADNLVIPLIDFSLFLNGTPAERQSAASSILTGFQNAGFIYLINHPISSSTVSTVFQTSAKFFTRPTAQKDALGWTTPRANRGYVAHGREKTTTLTSKEESFEIGREGAEGMPNNWPSGDEDAETFKNVMIDFHNQAKDLHIEVMRAIAVGMGLEGSYFDSYTDVGDNTLRLLHYPPAPKEVFRKNRLQVRAGEHTDYGSITLLFQDNRGGLQVKSPDGTFVNATPIPGSVVVNAGDLLARWSNDTIKSTLHRVVEPPSPAEGDMYPARYSVAYFCNPNYDSQIEAIEGTYGGEKGERKYSGINSGDYLEMRLAATY
ncbi:hypothetical protein B0O99DRAFT_649655 [Bisporella sp. PMI_857]|nr:hypothetical protein B0O99DRAFT_649655 [Bisporella sp. PMI_857]